MEDDLVAETQRVLEAVREAARRPLEEGAAELRIASVRELYGTDAAYDWPVVLLNPRRPSAARVTVEIQDLDQWWLAGADGPGYELYAGMQRDWYALLGKLVRAIVAGHYEYGWQERRRRLLLLRPWRHRAVHVWVARFGRGEDAESTVHQTLAEGKDHAHHRFDAYL